MSNRILEEQNLLLQHRERILSEMKKYPNVVTVGVGIKEINDELTSILCYRVYVSEKKSSDLLKEAERIPAVIDGFITDVIPYGVVEEIAMDNGHYRPLKGGIQIKNDQFVDDSKRGGGTLGCLAILNDGSEKIVGLTNKHVVAWNSEDTSPEDGNNIGQPWKVVCCCCCTRNIIGKVLDSADPNEPDCAIIELHDDIINGINAGGTINEIAEIGAIKGKAIVTAGTLVKKRGAATGVTHGIVKDVAFDTNQLLIAPVEPSEKFADFGDSGSIVLTEENFVIGLLWAANRDRFRIPGEEIILGLNIKTPLEPRLHGVATPIDAVEAALGIKIPIPPPVIPTITIHPDDTKTFVVPSTLPASENPKQHFVTVKGEGDIILKVTFDQPVESHRFKWVSDNSSIQIVSPGIGTDVFTAKISRNVTEGAGARIGITVDGYSVGEKVFVWIIWTKIDKDNTDAVEIDVKVTENHIAITDSLRVRFLIQPSRIIPTDINKDDVPDLRGPNTVPPPDVPSSDTGVFNKGVDLSGGARTKWDGSKRVRCKVININGILLPSTELFNQTFPNYPSSPLVGNYDTTSLSLEGDPYSDENLGEFGKVISDAVISHFIPHSVGFKNHKLEFRIHTQQFARLELGGLWHIISDTQPWKLHIGIKKMSELDDNTDYDGDGDKSGEVWVNDVNITEDGLNNDDF